MHNETPKSAPGYLSAFVARIGDALANYLSKPRLDYRPFSTLSGQQLEACLQPGDLILVEGNSLISTAIKYLTQSTWSHVAMYIGDQPGLNPILEADLVGGVITVPIDKYNGFNLRICRPVNLTPADTQTLLHFVIKRIGLQYDNKNIIDLMRYLFPTPPVPPRFRRRLLAFGSGDPTKAICSTLVAQAFQSIRYPILPLQPSEYLPELSLSNNDSGQNDTDNEHQAVSRNSVMSDDLVLAARHYSHFTPRDFDLSPYFSTIKPTIAAGFNYKDIIWDKQ